MRKKIISDTEAVVSFLARGLRHLQNETDPNRVAELEALADTYLDRIVRLCHDWGEESKTKTISS